MTENHKSFVVFVEKNTSPDMEKSIIAAIRMVRGVLDIAPAPPPRAAAPPQVVAADHDSLAPADPLLSAAQAAAERGQGLSTFWRDVKAGHVPPAYYVGSRSPRWRRSELRAALEACRPDSRVGSVK